MKKISFAKAYRKRLHLTKKQAKEIKQMYLKIAKDLQKKIDELEFDDTATGSLQFKQLDDLLKILEKEYNTLSGRLEKKIISNMNLTSEAVLSELPKGFLKEAEAVVRTDVISQIVSGRLYRERFKTKDKTQRGFGLSSKIWSDNKQKVKETQSIISKGIAENKSTYEIAKDLEKYVNPNKRKAWEWSKVYPHTAKRIDYNAQRLARTEVAHAYQQTVVESCKENPDAKGILWLASNSAHVCPLCQERDGQIFDPDNCPLDHPNGKCTFAIVMKDDYQDYVKKDKE